MKLMILVSREFFQQRHRDLQGTSLLQIGGVYQDAHQSLFYDGSLRRGRQYLPNGKAAANRITVLRADNSL